MERVLLRGISVFFLAAAPVRVASASTTVTVVPTDGISATSAMKSNICPGQMWNCVNDPVGAPDYDSTYVYKDTTATSGEHVVSFSGNIAQITGITMHIIAATNGGVGTAQMLFYNNGVVAGTGGLKTLTSTYTQFDSGPFTTQIADISNLTMKVVLTNTSGTGSLKYTAIWMAVTYGAQGTTLGSMETHLMMYQDADGTPHSPDQDFIWSDGTGYKAGSCTSGACAGGSGGTTLALTRNVAPPSPRIENGSSDNLATKIVVSGENAPLGKYPSALEWVKVEGDPSTTDTARNLKVDWWAYLEATASNDPNTLEFDAFWGDGNLTAMWGSHCNFTAGHWQLDAQDGTGGWTDAIDAGTGQGIPCNFTASSFSKNEWHHVTWELHHDPTAGKIYYDKLTVDGTTYVLTAASKTFGYKSSGGWHTLGAQVQQDLNGAHEPFNEYIDAMSLTYW